MIWESIGELFKSARNRVLVLRTCKGLLMCFIIGTLFGALGGWIIPPFASLRTTELYSFVIFSILPSIQVVVLALLFPRKFPSSWQSVYKRFVCIFISFLFFLYGYPTYTFLERKSYNLGDHLIWVLIIFLGFIYSFYFILTPFAVSLLGGSFLWIIGVNWSLYKALIVVILLSSGSSCLAAYLASKGIENFRKRIALAFSVFVMSLMIPFSSVGMLALGT